MAVFVATTAGNLATISPAWWALVDDPMRIRLL